MDVLPSLIEKYFDRLWPICRSITGNGVRESLKILSEIVPLAITEVPSGTKVFDWTVPPEWNVREAYIITPAGQRICDLKTNNLHLVGYSTPINAKLSWEELAPHLHTREDLPEAIPYITSYYKPAWGFCIAYNEWKDLPREGMYQVVIDSSHNSAGSLTWGEAVLKGESDREVLISTYVCHPSMANNELSGPLVAAFLYKVLAGQPIRHYTYRFAFTTETIGTLAYLAQRGTHLREKIIAGYVLTCCGDEGSFTCKRSRRGNTFADFHVQEVLKNTQGFTSRDFEPWGSDERQYCSPGFNLPVGVFMRTPFQEYPQYHTSLDDKSFISFDAMAQSVNVLNAIMMSMESDPVYVNTVMGGEPQLGKRQLYENLSTTRNQSEQLRLRLRLLNYCDGSNGLKTFMKQYAYKSNEVNDEVEALCKAGLLRRI